jgi:hypothetical protein
MSPGTSTPLTLLLMLAAMIGGGAVMVAWVFWLRRRERLWGEFPAESEEQPPENVFTVSPLRAFWRRPTCWLAIRSRNLLAVQTALRLDNAKSCSWTEGLSSDRRLFLSPPLQGWILVMGAGLPDPSEDVDECFRFLVELSRRVGHVQLFKADATLMHHAWARVEAGRVVRAYAWAGGTIWTQGAKTQAESDLVMKCYGYGESARPAAWGFNELIASNVEKVPMLAARWSLNPAEIDARLVERSRGVTGWPAWRF